MNAKIIAVIAVVVLVGAGVGGYAFFKNHNESNKIKIDVNLEVFGNADKDDKITNDDASMVEKYIKAKNDNDQATLDELSSKISTEFADANRDGKIDNDDVEQIKQIVSGTEKHIWILDGQGNVKKVNAESKSIGCEYFANTELCLILGLSDRIKAVDFAPYKYRSFYFSEEKAAQISDLGNMSEPNYDEVNKLNLDTLLTFYISNQAAKETKIYNCDVLYLGCYNPDITNTDKSAFIQGILKAGYIFKVVDRAEKYADWLLKYRDQLLDIAKSIPEADKPVVMSATYGSAYFVDGSTKTVTVYKPADPLGQAIELAGGHNVFKDLKEKDITSSSLYGATVSIDTVLGTNTTVEYIFLHMVRYTYGGMEMTSTPKHGYLIDSTEELSAGQNKMKALDLVEDDMDVRLIAGEFRNGCSAGVLLGAFMGKIINPDAYSSVDPVKMMNEYIDWMGVSGFDAKEHGQYVYPGLSA